MSEKRALKSKSSNVLTNEKSEEKLPTTGSLGGLSPLYQRRVLREIQSLQKEPVDFVTPEFNAEKLTEIICYIEGPKDSIYAGEKFTLKITFTNSYPMECPIVVFVPPMVPKHEHCYTNGHICLSILYDQWSPSITVKGILLSIVSMLSSAKVKKHPIDNRDYVRHAPSNPKETTWDFHDDKC
ncbi:putative ubiquitin-conjugating enzyme E2 W [Monocercomonoides exilis]|uniref:putative ubiquitin-conjugating enzyme E2 W n=1 Tax=Monocercomonoides exilis TaxID=2049356 RepID=UPI00355A9219|nr:putative ubiquitin-conjugating enzyme E2 W [Monocercomonoides exilis]|eukprot:MONOS_11716.1-p1 / transcript=MONOS_11716.1 / gene=MONOS_11716 / organism=Monocercomonoides_exilis_PA203 / gene_product=Probable ubiquitin-conjugating enzyme E2 W / transcript_product=Probable ubiquitin-conjugating enzyme E2 W / location=Mono_scaffold00604:18838-19643(+) / protein_length=182 / sequence_SO=supercontig / SO=protein_coding / is_pseudo=false